MHARVTRFLALFRSAIADKSMCMCVFHAARENENKLLPGDNEINVRAHVYISFVRYFIIREIFPMDLRLRRAVNGLVDE